MAELTSEFWEDWGAMKSQIAEIHQVLTGDNGLTKRVREIEIANAEMKKELEIRQNWLSTLSATVGATLAYLAAYFTIKP